MGRSADYTIQGFLYQFNQTLAELLKASDDAEIAIEGIIEDIEVATYSGTKAIQCKYHETQTKYTLSTLYHPLLQMMKHFKSNPSAKIHYHLFVHFPEQTEISITEVELTEVLQSKNKELKTLIEEIDGLDLSKFIKVLTITVTPKYEELMNENIRSLEGIGFNSSEVETLFYPNAIQIIANLSIKHEAGCRKIAKRDFLSTLQKIRSTAVTQWTLALTNRRKILDTRRKQLKENLNTNSRLRHVIIFPALLEQFNDQIVIFIKSFIDKYNFKLAHTQTPIFALDVTSDELDDIGERLIGKDITPNLGRPVKAFSEAYFLREPLASKEKKEFSLRLICLDDYKRLRMTSKADDLFVIGKGEIQEIDTQDINIEILEIEQFNEIRYVMGISNAY